MPQTCANCRYSDPRIGDDGDPYLRCRRYPPVVTMLDGPEPVSVFAQTSSDEWCGEWVTTTTCECGHGRDEHWRGTGNCLASTETETWACDCARYREARGR